RGGEADRGKTGAGERAGELVSYGFDTLRADAPAPVGLQAGRGRNHERHGLTPGRIVVAAVPGAGVPAAVTQRAGVHAVSMANVPRMRAARAAAVVGETAGGENSRERT